MNDDEITALAVQIYIAMCGNKSKDANFKSLALYAFQAAEAWNVFCSNRLNHGIPTEVQI